MGYDDYEEKKGLRITNIILQCVISGVLFVMAYALYLTTDFIAYNLEMMAPLMGYSPMYTYILNTLTGCLILQYGGVVLMIIAGVRYIILAIMKNGKP